jgi:hypothetical protein
MGLNRRDWARPAIAVPFLCAFYFLCLHRSPGYAAGSVLLLGAFLWSQARWDTVAGGPAGMALLGLAAAVLPALGAWQYLHLRDIGDYDHSCYSVALWNLAHGNPHYEYLGRNIFGVHSQYTMALWIPVQALAGELGLKIGNGSCLLAAAALLLRRHWAQRRAAAWGALALLLAPPIASQFFFGFHPEMLAAPLLVLALGAYRDQRLGRFLILTALLAFTKETLTLAVGGILLVALAERRSWKWVLLPGFLCCALMAIYWLGVMPRFAPLGNPLAFFFPASPAEILSNWARPQTLRYLFHTALPFLPLLLAMPKRYLLLPLPTMAFYAAFPDPLFVQMWPNYAFPLPILCLAGLVLSPDLRIGAAEGAEGRGKVLDGRILQACALTALLCYPLWREIFSIPRDGMERNREAMRIRAETGGAAVLVHGNMAARFAGRRRVSLLGLERRPVRDFDFAVIDPAYRPPWPLDSQAVADAWRDLADTADWEQASARAGITFYRRRAPKP